MCTLACTLRMLSGTVRYDQYTQWVCPSCLKLHVCVCVCVRGKFKVLGCVGQFSDVNKYKLAFSFGFKHHLNSIESSIQFMPNCPRAYIGQTSRTLGQRFKWHQRSVCNSDIATSALAEHSNSTGHPIQWDEAHVTDTCSHTSRQFLLESWAIHKESSPWTEN